MTETESKNPDFQKTYTTAQIAESLGILLIAPSLESIGGQSIQAKRLLDAFADEPQIKIGFLPTNPRLTSFLRFLQKYKYLRTIFTSLKFIRLLIKDLPNYDVIQVFSASNTSYIISTIPPLLIAKLYGRKIILNYHSGEAEDHFERWNKVVLPTLKRFDEIVVPSEFLVKVFAEIGFKATPIYNFVDGNVFKFRSRESFKPVFLSNRNLEPLYNVECILQSFELIQKKYPQAKLLIAGGGKESEKLKRISGELKLNQVEFLGEVSQKKMPELYEQTDIYLNSSNIDNMPLSIIEAFSCGTPVVTTDAGGIPYLVKHEKTGLLVAKGDYKALANEAMRILEDNNLAQQIANEAKEDCLESYSWKNVREKWLRLYSRLCKDNSVIILMGLLGNISIQITVFFL